MVFILSVIIYYIISYYFIVHIRSSIIIYYYNIWEEGEEKGQGNASTLFMRYIILSKIVIIITIIYLSKNYEFTFCWLKGNIYIMMMYPNAIKRKQVFVHTDCCIRMSVRIMLHAMDTLYEPYNSSGYHNYFQIHHTSTTALDY